MRLGTRSRGTGGRRGESGANSGQQRVATAVKLSDVTKAVAERTGQPPATRRGRCRPTAGGAVLVVSATNAIRPRHEYAPRRGCPLVGVDSGDEPLRASARDAMTTDAMPVVRRCVPSGRHRAGHDRSFGWPRKHPTALGASLPSRVHHPAGGDGGRGSCRQGQHDLGAPIEELTPGLGARRDRRAPEAAACAQRHPLRRGEMVTTSAVVGTRELGVVESATASPTSRRRLRGLN